MQSVYKFHIALAVLSEVDKGKLDLNQKIKITTKDLCQKHGVPFAINILMEQHLLWRKLFSTVSESDNNGCDLLLRLLGGPAFVDNYFRMADFSDISIKATEQEMHSGWDVQFSNWTTPIAATNLLKAFYMNELKLSKTVTIFIGNNESKLQLVNNE
ncbi:MAG: serine hydrolase [Bacteroidetes bacterium]|nr:serine hydrolase [Bacteroidota bacterium]